MPRVERIDAYPIKGLDRCPLVRAAILPGGTLEHDREYALYDRDGDVINGKRTPRVHDVSTNYNPDTGVLTVDPPGAPATTFDLPEEAAAAASLFTSVFEESLSLDRNAERGFVDRPAMGPSVVSTATLREIASWFEEMTLDGARRRFRANVEVGGVPAFWEDRFVGEDAPAFRVGDVRFEGETPCGRCVVPSRDPDTGQPIEDFRERFLDRRATTFPAWADPDAFDHHFTAMIITTVPDADRGQSIAVGDEVEVLG